MLGIFFKNAFGANFPPRWRNGVFRILEQVVICNRGVEIKSSLSQHRNCGMFNFPPFRASVTAQTLSFRCIYGHGMSIFALPIYPLGSLSRNFHPICTYSASFLSKILEPIVACARFVQPMLLSLSPLSYIGGSKKYIKERELPFPGGEMYLSLSSYDLDTHTLSCTDKNNR